jgi:hypothetical protein
VPPSPLGGQLARPVFSPGCTEAHRPRICLSKVHLVDQRMSLGMRCRLRQPRTCRRTRPGQPCGPEAVIRSPRPYCAPGYSGNPAFRSPSICSKNDCVPRAINADIVKAGSISSTRAAASRASASRPRWPKADARQR